MNVEDNNSTGLTTSALEQLLLAVAILALFSLELPGMLVFTSRVCWFIR
jgi:hypothetical protein